MAILERYPYVLKGYYIRVLIGPEGLLYSGTHRSSRAILEGTHRSSRSYSVGGTHRSSRSYSVGVPIGPEVSKAIKGRQKGARDI